MKRLNHKQCDVLIQLIKEKPYLFDRSDENYKHFKMRKAAWKEISEKVGLSPSDCKITWKSLRDQFARTHKALNENQGEPPNKVYKYYEKLLFLADVYEADVSQTTMKRRSEAANESNDASEPFTTIPAYHLEIQMRSPSPKKIKEEDVSFVCVTQQPTEPATTEPAPTEEVVTVVTSSSHEVPPPSEEPAEAPVQKPSPQPSKTTSQSRVDTDQYFLSLSAMVKTAELTAAQVRQVQRTLLNALVDKLDSFENA